MKVGFVGLGGMGSGMARRLQQAGHDLTVYNRTRSRADELAKEGARVVDTVAQAAAGVEVLVSMLADDRVVDEVIFSPGNAVNALPPGSCHVSMSTISVACSRRLATVHREQNQAYVAAPVFGRPEAAAAGKLYIVAAGPHDQIEKCRPLFNAMGQKLFEVGPDGPEANLFKIAGNFMIAAMIESLAEAFALVRKSGLEPRQFLEVLTGSLFDAPVFRNYGAMLAADRFEPAGFRLPLGLKDNRLALAAAEEVAVPLPLANLVRDRFLAAIALGMSESDWAAIARIASRDAGLA
jgi:3-hydroxyisobutyrate dehydrogenase-like beta-hydroxyacid dehydrogenase